MSEPGVDQDWLQRRLAMIEAPPQRVSSWDRFGFTLSLAMVIHVFLILGISFTQEEESRLNYDAMEVTLVQMESDSIPDADVLAQANMQGGGEQAEDFAAAAPQPALLPAPEPLPITTEPVANAAVDAAPPPQEVDMNKEVAEVAEPLSETVVESPAQSSPELLTTSKINDEYQVLQSSAGEEVAAVEETEPQPQEELAAQPQPQPVKEQPKKEQPKKSRRKKVSATQLLTNSYRIASLSAEVRRKWEAKEKRPRRKFVSAATREYKYASYMAQWVRKVERIGTLNYPEEARKRGVSGSLRLDVALHPDGTVASITIRQSSGYKVLDEAALRIVRLAAPYAPFPESIRNDTDILHITRSWRFKNNRFLQ